MVAFFYGRLTEVKVTVVDYNPEWPDHFEKLRDLIWPTISELALTLEHVGSTSVPGLAAKAVIDLDIVISDRSKLSGVIGKLQSLGYEHLGDLGIQGREAFKAPPSEVKHNLYLCCIDNLAFRNHIMLRDFLRSDLVARDRYAQLKRDLAKEFPDSIDSYVEGKSQFILEILSHGGMSSEQLEMIKKANAVS